MNYFNLDILLLDSDLTTMSEEEGGAEDVSFLRTEDMVTLSCTGTGERVCLSAEGFGNRQCFLESIADKVIFRIIINHIYINDFPVEFLKILIFLPPLHPASFACVTKNQKYAGSSLMQKSSRIIPITSKLKKKKQSISCSI